jgi:hypothetical protein
MRINLLLLWAVVLALASPALAQTNQTIGTGVWASGPTVGSYGSSHDAEDLCIATTGCATGTGPVGAVPSQILRPGEVAWYVVTGDADGEDNVNANADDGDRDSAKLNVRECPSVTTRMVKLVGDSDLCEGIFMQTDSLGTISDPVCADIDADGDVDCTVMNGDTGIDQDGGGTSVNNSLFQGWGPVAGGHLWVDITTSPGTSKVCRWQVTCQPAGGEVN